MSLAANLENAFLQVLSLTLSADWPGLHFYLGFDSEEQERPCVVCICEGGPEQPLSSGNRLLRMRILVKGSADKDTPDSTPVDDYRNLMADVESAVVLDGWADLLMAVVDDLFVYAEGTLQRGWERDPDGRSFTDAFLLDVYCSHSLDAERPTLNLPLREPRRFRVNSEGYLQFKVTSTGLWHTVEPTTDTGVTYWNTAQEGEA